MHVIDKKRLYEQIAHLVLCETPQNHIAKVVGLSDSRVSEILDEEEYKLAEQDVAAKSYQQATEVNERWDNLQNMALTNLEATMKYNRDPDLNLRIALAANKADRRRANVSPIQSASVGMRAQLTLPTVMVQMIMQGNGGVIPAVPVVSDPNRLQSKMNVLVPGKVEGVLQEARSNPFAGINLGAPEDRE